MLKSSRLEEDKNVGDDIIKDLFKLKKKLKKETIDTAIKDIRKFFILKKKIN